MMNKISTLIFAQALLLTPYSTSYASDNFNELVKTDIGSGGNKRGAIDVQVVDANLSLPTSDLHLNPVNAINYTLSPQANSSLSTGNSPATLHESDPVLLHDANKDLFYREFASVEQSNIYHTQHKQEKIIGGHDRRERLNERVKEKDWNCQVYLEILYNIPNGKTKMYYGSGTLIDYHLLLTAGHVLYDSKDGGYPDRIDCFAACYQYSVMAEGVIFPKKNPESVMVPQDYIKYGKDKKTADMGLIIFNSDTATLFKNKGLTIAQPYLNIFGLGLDVFNKIEFYITGYPGLRVAHSMGGKVQKGEGDQEGLVIYDIDTEEGQSGSAIWFKNKGKIYCIGVHTYAGKKGEDYNIGTLFHPDILKAIEANKIV